MTDDIRRRLKDAARHPVPAPDPAFARALEERLRAVADSLPAAAPSSERRARVPFRRRLASAGVVVAVLTIAIGAIVSNSRPALARELLAPVNVEVSLADGTTLQDPVGLELPEGAVVRVFAGGSARIDGTVLGPGDVATVTAGQIMVQHRPSVGVLPGPSPTRSPRATPTPGSDTARPSRAPTPPPTRTPRPSPRLPAPITPTPTPSKPASPEPSARPTPTPTVAPTPTPTPTPRILRPKLRARVVGRTIVVNWTATLRARSYVLVVTRSRSGPAPVPVYPGARIVGRFAHAPAKPVRFRSGSGVVEVRLMVVALRRDGSVLRRSRVVILTVPRVAVPRATTGP